MLDEVSSRPYGLFVLSSLSAYLMNHRSTISAHSHLWDMGLTVCSVSNSDSDDDEEDES